MIFLSFTNKVMALEENTNQINEQITSSSIETTNKEDNIDEENKESSSLNKTLLNGFVVINSNTYYYENGIMLKGIQIINGKRYFLGEASGILKKDGLQL